MFQLPGEGFVVETISYNLIGGSKQGEVKIAGGVNVGYGNALRLRYLVGSRRV